MENYFESLSRSHIVNRLEENLFQHPRLVGRMKNASKKRFRSFCAQSSRKRHNVTVFRHGAPEYCGSTLPAPVPTLTPDGAFSHSLVRRGFESTSLVHATQSMLATGAPTAANALRITQDKFCNHVCSFNSSIRSFTYITYVTF